MPRSPLPPVAGLAFLVIVAGCAGARPDDFLARNCPAARTNIERFSLCLPDGWSAETEQFGDRGNFIVRIREAEGVASLAQIHVKKDPLEEDIRSGMAFARRAVEIARETAPNYAPVSTEPISIDGRETLLHVFDASPDPDVDPVRYYQFVTTFNGIAYGFTAVIFAGGNEELRQTLLDVFTNVRFT